MSRPSFDGQPAHPFTPERRAGLRSRPEVQTYTGARGASTVSDKP